MQNMIKKIASVEDINDSDIQGRAVNKEHCR